MNFAYDSVDRKIELFADNSTSNGGNWIMNNSLLIPLSSCTSSENIELHPSPLCDPLIYSIHRIEENNSINVYPNPTMDVISVVLDEKLLNNNIQVRLSDIQGKLFIDEIIYDNYSNILKLNLSTLNKGIYFLSIKVGSVQYTTKIIKK